MSPPLPSPRGSVRYAYSVDAPPASGRRKSRTAVPSVLLGGAPSRVRACSLAVNKNVPLGASERLSRPLLLRCWSAYSGGMAHVAEGVTGGRHVYDARRGLVGDDVERAVARASQTLAVPLGHVLAGQRDALCRGELRAVCIGRERDQAGALVRQGEKRLAVAGDRRQRVGERAARQVEHGVDRDVGFGSAVRDDVSRAARGGRAGVAWHGAHAVDAVVAGGDPEDGERAPRPHRIGGDPIPPLFICMPLPGRPGPKPGRLKLRPMPPSVSWSCWVWMVPISRTL